MAVDIPSMIAAVGALGTASYGLVDATKAFWGGISNAGFKYIRQVIMELLPTSDSSKGQDSLLSRSAALADLKAIWMNGTSLADQKTNAKLIVKLRMNDDNARSLAQKAGVDADMLIGLVKKTATGETLTPTESAVSERFDNILLAALDQAYERADQRYRNWCKLLTVPMAMALAIFGGWTIWNRSRSPSCEFYFCSGQFVKALVAGLLATPLAPVVKDISSAVQAGTKVAQSITK